MFSATDAAFEGFRLARRHPLLMIFWGIAFVVGLALALSVLFAALARSMIHALLTGDRAVEALDPPFSAVGMAIGFPIFFAAMLLISAMTITAVYRAILRPKDRGFGYLRIGGDEGRQILLMLLILLVDLAALIGGGVLVTTAVAFTPAAWKGLAGVVVVVVCLLLAIWVATRLSLASAMTFAERRVTLFDSWTLTRGRFWPLLGMWLLAFVLSIVVSLVATALSYLPAVFAPGGLKALSMHAWPDATSMPASGAVIAVLVAQGLIQVVGMAVQLAVATAPGAAAYAQLKSA